MCSGEGVRQACLVVEVSLIASRRRGEALRHELSVLREGLGERRVLVAPTILDDAGDALGQRISGLIALAAFFAGTTVKANFLINLGYGDASKLFARSPRFTFDEAAQIV